jgi:hypothetical protein
LKRRRGEIDNTKYGNKINMSVVTRHKAGTRGDDWMAVGMTVEGIYEKQSRMNKAKTKMLGYSARWIEVGDDEAVVVDSKLVLTKIGGMFVILKF